MLKPEVLHSQVKSQDKDLLTAAKDLIAREIKICRNLRSLVSRELEAIVIDGDTDELLKLFEKKDALISELRALVLEWQEIFESERGSNFNNNNFTGQILEIFPDDEELAGLINQTHELAGSIMQAEQEAITELDKYSSGLRSNMAQRIQGKNAAASYARMGGSII